MTAAIAGRLLWRERLGWSVGDYGVNLYWQAISLYLYYFYTDVMGLSPSMAGIAFAVGSIWDGVSDPVIGSVADRTRTRWGSYRPFLLWASVPCAVTFVLAFWAPPLAGAALLAYAITSHVVMRTCLAAIGIPYNALSARLTTDAGERATLAGLRMCFAALGAITVALLTPKLLAALNAPERVGFPILAALFAAAATAILLLCFAATRERVAAPLPARGAEQRGALAAMAHDLRGFWGMLRVNGPLARVFVGIVTVSVALTMFGKCIVYWFKYQLNRPDLTGFALALPALVLILCVPFWVWVARRFSKRAAWLLGSALAAMGYAGLWLSDSNSLVALFASIVVIALGTSAYAVTFWAMLPDTVEYNEVHLGVRAEGKVFGYAALAQKLALAVNALILGQALEWLGFVANRPQDSATLAGLKAIMCLVPFMGALLSAAVIWRYPITPVYHARLLDQLAARRTKVKSEENS